MHHKVFLFFSTLTSWWKFCALIVASSSVKEMLSSSLHYTLFSRVFHALYLYSFPVSLFLRQKYVDRPFWCEIRSSVIDRQRCRDDETTRRQNVSSAETLELCTQLAPCCVNERVHGRIIEILLPAQWVSLGINKVFYRIYCTLHRYQALPCCVLFFFAMENRFCQQVSLESELGNSMINDYIFFDNL